MNLENHNGLGKYASLFTWLVAMVPAVAFTFSIFYDLGMFGAIGISFSEAPTSIADHFRTSLNGVPAFTISVAIIGILYLWTNKAENRQIGNEAPSSAPITLTKNKLDLALLGISIFSILLWIFSWLFLGDSRIPMGAPLTVITVCFFISIGIALNKQLNQNFNQQIIRALAFSPVLLASFYVTGFGIGLSALEGSDPKQRIHVGDVGVGNSLDVEIVRSLGNWMIVVPKPEPNDFLWIRMDEIRQIEILDKGRFRGIGCWFYRNLCTTEE